MRTILGGTVFFVLFSVAAYAESTPPPPTGLIHKGQVELGGATSLSFSRQTFSSGGAGSSFNTTLVTTLATYYVTDRVGVGATVAYVNFAVPASSGATGTALSYTAAGGVVKIRFPLSIKSRADFFVSGTGGIARVGTSGYASSSSYFAGGAGTDVFLATNAALALSLQYLHTNLTGAGISALSVSVGFSLYFK